MRVWLTILLASHVAIVGCAANNAAMQAQTAQGADPELVSTVDDDSAAPRAADGLELRQWKIVDDPHRIAAAMARHAEPISELSAAEPRLQRNGWRVARVRLDHLSRLRDDMGQLTMDVKGWYGQIPIWRSVLEQPMGPSVQVIALDGRFREVDADACRLMARGWTLFNEDGPRYELQLVPQLQAAAGGQLLPRLRDERPGNESLTSGALRLQLEGGWAYLLTTENPSVNWSAQKKTAQASTSPEGEDTTSLEGAAGSPEATSARRPPPLQQPDSTGPDAVTPPTLGSLMLESDTSPPTRGMLIFIARFPQSMMSQMTSAASSPRSVPPSNPPLPSATVARESHD